jgi:hypothetical protein
VYLADMQKLMIVFAVAIVLCACSRHYEPLEDSKKARLVSELINDAPRCKTFKDQLASPSMDDDKIDDVYHAAVRAQCTNRHS